jgi:arsenate reductase
MAEGFMRRYGGGKVECFSAGISSTFVHPMAQRVMKEKGVDISHQTSKSLDEIDPRVLRKITHVATLCGEADELCPRIPKQTPIYKWAFPDPLRSDPREKERVFREVCDGIEKKVKELLKELKLD